jgi:hypothetical protein
MSRPHEQKHFLHNRSYCGHCDCPQISRIVLGIIFAHELCWANLVAHRDQWNLHSLGIQPEPIALWESLQKLSSASLLRLLVLPRQFHPRRRDLRFGECCLCNRELRATGRFLLSLTLFFSVLPLVWGFI